MSTVQYYFSHTNLSSIVASYDVNFSYDKTFLLSVSPEVLWPVVRSRYVDRLKQVIPHT